MESSGELSPAEKQRKNETYIARFMVHKPLALYDIGIGPKTEWKTLSDIFPGLILCGVEPNPAIVESITRNGWNGNLISKAVTSKRGPVKLTILREDGQDASILSLRNPAKVGSLKVASITLDAADKVFGKQPDVLLWMDIEGAELDALKSGSKLLSSGRVRWINVEVRHESPWVGGCTAPEVHEFLLSFGYKKIADYNKHSASGHWDTIYFIEDEPVNENPTYRDAPTQVRS